MSDREHKAIMWLGLAIILAFLTTMLTGCGADRQNASDAHAGARAIGQSPEATQTIRTIAGGVGNHVLATVGAERYQDLPPPQTHPEEILQDSAGYVEQSESALEAALSSPWSWIAGGALGLLGLLRAWPGTAGRVAGWVHGLLANRVDRQVQDRRESLEAMASELFDTLRSLDTETRRRVREAARNRLPARVWDAFLELERERGSLSDGDQPAMVHG